MYGIVSITDPLKFEDFSTDIGAYINADYSTGFVGVFDKGKMVKSQQASVIGQIEIDQVIINLIIMSYLPPIFPPIILPSKGLLSIVPISKL